MSEVISPLIQRLRELSKRARMGYVHSTKKVERIARHLDRQPVFGSRVTMAEVVRFHDGTEYARMSNGMLRRLHVKAWGIRRSGKGL